jgi:UPF0755 protein
MNPPRRRGPRAGCLGLALLAVAAGLVLWGARVLPEPEQVLAGLDRPAPGGPALFTVEPGDTAATVADRLFAAGLVWSPQYFRILAALEGKDVKLQTGEYAIPANPTVREVLELLTSSRTRVRRVTVPEGLQTGQVAEVIARALDRPVEEVTAWLEPGRLDHPILREKPPDASLEGYLMPDTYVVGWSQGPEVVFRLMLDALANRLTPEVRAGAAERGLSVHGLLTLASIVEREAKVDEERPLIASVFLNRLRLGMRLEADPTVQYALARDPLNLGRFGYWKPELTADDLQVDSPYNTYKYAGLPPGPICNPGFASIRAVAGAPETPYLFFVLDRDGQHHRFAATWEEHLRNVREVGR